MSERILKNAEYPHQVAMLQNFNEIQFIKIIATQANPLMQGAPLLVFLVPVVTLGSTGVNI